MRKAAVMVVTLSMSCGPVGPARPSSATSPVPSATVTEGSSSPAQARAGSPIVAQLTLTNEQASSDADVEVNAHIENRGTDQIVLLAEELKSPAVLFEVRDATGTKIPPTSPPVPSGAKHVVEPGKSIDIKMSLAGMFSPPLKPGEYSIRLRRIDSTPRLFKIH